MKYKFAIILIITIMIIGCSSEKDRVISKLKSDVEDKYSIVIFNDSTFAD